MISIHRQIVLHIAVLSMILAMLSIPIGLAQSATLTSTYTWAIFATLGSSPSVAEDINNHGQVVGYSDGAPLGSQYATPWQAGQLNNLANQFPLGNRLSISSIDASGDFAQTNNCGGSVAAGASCTIDVTFSPTATGSRTGTLTPISNAADSPHVVSLSGIGSATSQPATLAPPTNLTAVAVDPNQIDLHWVDNTASETAFRIERAGDGNIWNPLVTLPANSTPYSDVALLPNTTYYYRMQATNDAGNSVYTPVISETTPAGENGAGQLLTVNRSGSGSGTISSTPSGIDCGSDCSESYADGTQVTLTATPDDLPPITLTNLTSASSYVVTNTVGSTADVIHTFYTDGDEQMASVLTTLEPFASVFISVGQLNQLPDNYQGYVVISADQPITAQIVPSIAPTPTPDPTPKFTLTVSKNGSGSGTVTSAPAGIDCGSDCSENFADGTQVTLIASPNRNHSFGGWSGACSGTSTTCTVTIDAEKSVIAAFDQSQPGEEQDDLIANATRLWTDPVTPREGKSLALGLVVNRIGGHSGLPSTTVRFYRDAIHPDNLIGDGFTTPLGVNDSQSTSPVAWPNPTTGAYVVWAQIDPDGTIQETVESNNVVSRTITIQPQTSDTEPPVITNLRVNGGVMETNNRAIPLEVEAIDSGGSGLASVVYSELHWLDSAQSWVPVGAPVVQPYGQSHQMILHERGGLRYIQAWALDQAGNYSDRLEKRAINFIPAQVAIQAGEVHVYRQTVAAGQCLNVTLHSIQGDADLYIWQPNWTEEMDVLVANGTLPEDELTVPNAVAGQYQIEVEGFSDAAYSLAIVVGDVCNKGRAGQVGTERAAAKVTRARPWIALDSQPPAVNVATPDLPGAMSEGEFEIHLPLLNR